MDEPISDNDFNDDEPPQGHFSALVPERVAQGVFSTGAAVLEGPDEFVIDFFLRISRPQRVAARIVLAQNVMPRFIAALRENLAIYQRTFGSLPLLPRPRPAGESPGAVHGLSPATPPSGDLPPPSAAASAPPGTLEEMYSNLKLPDDVLTGTYANAVLIGHSATEFDFDFITNFFPRSAVAARVFMAAGQVPGFLDALIGCYEAHRRKHGG